MKQTIYFNGDIITMDEENPTVQAVLVQEDGILFAGDLDKALELAEENCEKIDLEGRTLMPAFIDPHSHFIACANSLLQCQLAECKSIDEICSKMKDFAETENILKGDWIRATGYDQNSLKEGRAPDRFELDKIFPDNPVVLQHASGHVGSFNSYALKELGVNRDTPCPDGGVMEKTSDGDLTGYMEENAFLDLLKKVPMPDINDILKAVKKAQNMYLSYGIATAQEGMFMDEMAPLYKAVLNENMLKLDIVAYISPQNSKKITEEFKEHIGKYKDNFKIGGDKIFLDGSPQGRTAWMRTAYKGKDENYCGYGTLTDEQVYKLIKGAADKDCQLLAHCNGDRAAQQYISVMEKFEQETGKKLKRPVMIHAQLLGLDQVEKLKNLDMIASFFVAHVYYWGDVHIKNFGFERASCISPANKALQEGVMFTFHQDTPVIEPDMLKTVWCAVNRITKDGIVLGNDMAVDVYSALKAVTINGAYQYFEEDVKGSLKKGKKADMIILSQNPLKTDKMDIRNIKVLKTIKNGSVVFEREE